MPPVDELNCLALGRVKSVKSHSYESMGKGTPLLLKGLKMLKVQYMFFTSIISHVQLWQLNLAVLMNIPFIFCINFSLQ